MQADISSRPSGTIAQLKVSRKGGTRTDSMYRVQVRSISMTSYLDSSSTTFLTPWCTRLHVCMYTLPLLYVHTINYTNKD